MWRPFPTCVLMFAMAGEIASAEPSSTTVIPLEKAIAEFNAQAALDPIGKEQPPLTKEEVLAAIRLAQSRDFSEAPVATFQAFQQIAKTRSLPPKASFDLLTGIDPGDDFIFDVWYVRISVPKEDGGSYSFAIRNRIIRLRPVSEVADEMERQLRNVPPETVGRSRLEDRLRDLKARAAVSNLPAIDGTRQND